MFLPLIVEATITFAEAAELQESAEEKHQTTVIYSKDEHQWKNQLTLTIASRLT